MDRLWSPWRYTYLSQAVPETGCVFCRIAAEDRDEENYVLFRGEHCYVVLNLFPYTNGHLMIVPYQHVADLTATPEPTLREIMLLTQAAERNLAAEYHPGGFNIGMNLGASAGAGVAGHLHMHVLPRWFGDANFMTTTAETRVLPESLAVTYQRLLPTFQLIGKN